MKVGKHNPELWFPYNLFEKEKNRPMHAVNKLKEQRVRILTRLLPASNGDLDKGINSV